MSPADPAVVRLGRAIRRFNSERLIDGEVSARITELTRLRQLGDDATFRDRRQELTVVLGARDGTYYARGHDITSTWIVLEDGDFARYHDRDLVTAEVNYERATHSTFALQVALAHLQLANLRPFGSAARQDHANLAETAASAVGATSLLQRAHDVQQFDIGEPFFP